MHWLCVSSVRMYTPSFHFLIHLVGQITADSQDYGEHRKKTEPQSLQYCAWQVRGLITPSWGLARQGPEKVGGSTCKWGGDGGLRSNGEAKGIWMASCCFPVSNCWVSRTRRLGSACCTAHWFYQFFSNIFCCTAYTSIQIIQKLWLPLFSLRYLSWHYIKPETP